VVVGVTPRNAARLLCLLAFPGHMAELQTAPAPGPQATATLPRRHFLAVRTVLGPVVVGFTEGASRHLPLGLAGATASTGSSGSACGQGSPALTRSAGGAATAVVASSAAATFSSTSTAASSARSAVVFGGAD
jgi:hypothetical protein